jgi:riboflavin synthase
MFTGLVQAVGRIERVEPREGGLRLTVDAAFIEAAAVRLGDSIAVNGCCLTAVWIEAGRFAVDVSNESLDRTANLDRVGDVNLELALAVGDRIGGHLVSGHVDGVGTVVDVRQTGDSTELILSAPSALAPLLAIKGSVAVDGVSLTINRVRDTAQGCEMAINLIPHTRQVTTFARIAPGRRVNLEVDQLARYVQRILDCRAT